eukprot:Hpha_TRINITY_DN22841_c0_g1::TRINITY_DN22841_c0_g1_i1::g.84331::m.84331
MADDDGFERMETTKLDGDGFERMETSASERRPKKEKTPAKPSVVSQENRVQPKKKRATSSSWRQAVRFEIVAAETVTLAQDEPDGAFIELMQVQKPTVQFFVRPGADPNRERGVVISCSTPAARIVYTTDGRTPTRDDTVYKEPISKWTTRNTTFKVIAMRPGMLQSPVCVAVCPLGDSFLHVALSAGLSDEVAEVLYAAEMKRQQEQRKLEARLKELEASGEREDKPLPIQDLQKTEKPKSEGSGASGLREFFTDGETSPKPGAGREEEEAGGAEVWIRPITDTAVPISGIRHVMVQQPERVVDAIEMDVRARLRSVLHRVEIEESGAVQALVWDNVAETSSDDSRPHIHVSFHCDPYQSRKLMETLEVEVGVGTLHGLLTMQDVAMVRWAHCVDPERDDMDWGVDYTTAVTLRRSVDDGARLSWNYMFMVSIAALVAGLGLGTDSAVAVVASMLISPIMGPILGSVLGALRGDWKTFLVATGVELLSIFACVVWGFIIALCFVSAPARASFYYLWPTGQMSDRSVSYGLVIGVLIAVPSGAGVALSLLNANANSLVGVAISASLLPPAVNAGMYYGFAMLTVNREKKDGTMGPNDHDLIVDGSISLALTGLNVVCIFFSALLVFKVRNVVLGDKSIEHRLKLVSQEPLPEASFWEQAEPLSSVGEEGTLQGPHAQLMWRRPGRAQLLSVDPRPDVVQDACRLSAIACSRKSAGSSPLTVPAEVDWTLARQRLLGKVGKLIKRQPAGLVGFVVRLDIDGEEGWWPASCLHPTCSRSHLIASLDSRDKHPNMLPPLETSEWQCDCCKEPQQARRFRCTEGCNYDLCRSCFEPHSAQPQRPVRNRVRIAEPSDKTPRALARAGSFEGPQAAVLEDSGEHTAARRAMVDSPSFERATTVRRIDGDDKKRTGAAFERATTEMQIDDDPSLNLRSATGTQGPTGEPYG